MLSQPDFRSHYHTHSYVLPNILVYFFSSNNSSSYLPLSCKLPIKYRQASDCKFRLQSNFRPTLLIQEAPFELRMFMDGCEDVHAWFILQNGN